MNWTENEKDQISQNNDIFHKSKMHTWTLTITEELIFAICLLCLIGNIITCFIIFKYRRLRDDSSYRIIANWFIFNSVFMLSTAFGLRVPQEYGNLTSPFSYAHCIIGQVQGLSRCGLFLLIMLLTIQWYLRYYHTSFSAKYDQTINYYIFGVYLTIIAIFINSTVSCIRIGYDLIGIIIVLAFFVLFNLFMVVIKILHFFKKKRLRSDTDKNIPYILSISFFWINVSFGPLSYFLSDGKLSDLIFICLSSVIGFLCPIYFISVLYKHDKLFKALVLHVISCRCRKYSGDEFFNQPVAYSNDTEA